MRVCVDYKASTDKKIISFLGDCSGRQFQVYASDVAKAHKIRIRIKLESLQELLPFQRYTALKSNVGCTLIFRNALYYSAHDMKKMKFTSLNLVQISLLYRL